MTYRSTPKTLGWYTDHNLRKWLDQNTTEAWNWRFENLNTYKIVLEFESINDYTLYVLTWESNGD